MKYQQRPVDVFVWDGKDIDGLREFVAPATADVEGVVARVNVPNCPNMLVPSNRVLRFADGTFDFQPREVVENTYEQVEARRHPPKHVLVDFGNGQKIDIDVANILLKDGECLRVFRGELGIVAEPAKYDELECTNGG